MLRILVEKNKDQKSSKKEDPLQLWRDLQTFIEANTYNTYALLHRYIMLIAYAYTNGLNSQDYDFIIKCIVLMIDVTNDWLKVKE